MARASLCLSLILAFDVVHPCVAFAAPVHLVATGDTFGFFGRDGRPGGVARRAAALAGLRSEGTTFLFDTGNALAPFYYARYDRGQFAAEMLAALGYDAVTLGNYDFELGGPRVSALIEDHALPLVLTYSLAQSRADTVDTREDLHAVVAVRTRVVERGGMRVGVVGLQGSTYSGFGDPFVQDALAALRAPIEDLQSSTDIVVLLSNAVFADTLAVARAMPAIDVAFGSAPHEERDSFEHDDDEPMQVVYVTRPDRPESVVVPVFRYGHRLSRVDLEFDRERVAEDVPVTRVSTLRLLPDSPQDLTLAQRVSEHVDALKAANSEVLIDNIAAAFPDGFGREELCIAVLAAMRNTTKASLAMLPVTALAKVDYTLELALRRDQLLLYDVQRMFWTDDALLNASFTGAELIDILNSQAGDLMVLGASRREGGWSIRGRPIDANENYSVALSDYLISPRTPVAGLRSGRFFYAEFAPAAKDPRLIRDVVIASFRGGVPEAGPVYPAEWRVHFDNWSAQVSTLSVNRSDAFADVRDARTEGVDLDSLQLSGRWAVSYDTASLNWTTDLSARYVRVEVNNDVVNNPLDQVRAGSELAFKALRFEGLTPVLRGLYETEFTANEGQPQRRVVRGFTGVQTTLGGWFSDLRFGAVVQLDVSRADEHASFGGLLLYRFDRPLIGSLALTSYLEARYLPFYGSERSDILETSIDFRVGLKVPVYANFFLVPNFELFLYDVPGAGRPGRNILWGIGFAYNRLWKPATQGLFGSPSSVLANTFGL